MVDKRSAFFMALVPRRVTVEAIPLEGFEPVASDSAPEDLARVASSTPARRREYLAGRFCARGALTRLGLEGAFLTAGPDRRPVWPAGVVGSIAHTRDWCVAIAARESDFRGLGVDLEPSDPIQERTWRKILTAEERRWIAARSPEDRGRLVRLLFSAKESAWKCRFPVDGRRFGFRDVDIRLDRDSGTFTASVLGDSTPGPFGRFQTDPDLIATVMCWPAARQA